MFVANVGTAVPIANTIELLGEVIANAGVPFQSVASGNTVTYQIQYANEVVASDPTAVGVAAFDSAFFDVDAAGFVTFSVSSFTQLQVDAHTAPGTDPVVPLAGVITVTGSQVGAGVIGTNVIRTDSLAANTMTIEIQRSSAQASTTLAANGVSHFDSAAFDVDANGFVQLNGGGIAITSVNVDAATAPGTDPVAPSAAGQISITGAQVAAGVVGTNVIRTNSLAVNSFTLEIQRSQAVGSSTVADNGVRHFDSARFTVDANGFVSTSGTGVLLTLTGNSGAAISPTAGNINTVGAGSITAVGSGSTITFQLRGLTNHSLLVGAGTSTITNLGVATNGQLPIGSTGADPVLAALTPGTGVSITNGAGSITIAATGSGMATVEVTGTSQAMAVDTFYIANNAGVVTLTLPVTAARGSVIEIGGKGAGGWLIAQNGGQQIQLGAQATTLGAGGSIASTNQWDSIRLRCITANTLWSVIGGPEGNITWV